MKNDVPLYRLELTYHEIRGIVNSLTHLAAWHRHQATARNRAQHECIAGLATDLAARIDDALTMQVNEREWRYAAAELDIRKQDH